MKQFRIKQYSHNSLYCIQQRTGLFSWKTLNAVPHRQHALNILNKLNKNEYEVENYSIIETSTNDVIVIIPTIAYHQKSLLFAWLNVAIGINF